MDRSQKVLLTRAQTELESPEKMVRKKRTAPMTSMVQKDQKRMIPVMKKEESRDRI